MKTSRIILIVLILFVITFFLVAAVLPSSYHIERRVAIDAHPQEVFQQINKLNNWKNWNPRMPEMQYNEIKSGAGASQAWMTPEGGKGYLKIESIQPNEIIRASIRFPGYDTFQTVWMLRAVNDSTYLTWGMDFDSLAYPVERYSGVLTNKRMQTNIFIGLNNLKDFLEQEEGNE